jgi:GntR family transcriptional regulator
VLTIAGGSVAANAEPLWMQTAARIKQEISDGDLVQGTRLRPERELTEEWGISRVTLRKALQHLVTEGVLSSSHGRGWYVASGEPTTEFPNTLESFSETARRMGLVASAQVVSQRRGSASLDEAEKLAVAPGTPVLRLERIRKMDDVAIALDTTVALLSALSGVDVDAVDFSTASLFRLLAESGSTPDRAESTIEAAAADEGVAALLDVAPGTPLLVMRQITTSGAADRAVALSTIQYVGERYRLRTAFARPR